MDTPATQAVVADCLAKLATHGSPRQIGEHLEAHGIALICDSANWGGNCPIARYVHTHTGYRVAVNERWAWIERGGHNVRLPSPLPLFVAAFDRATDGQPIQIDPTQLPGHAVRR